MSVKLRLSRMGRKKRPYYRIIAVDSRRKRDGAFIDRVGYYHPLDTPATVDIEADKALKWLRVGAIPSQTVLSLFRREGVWLRFRLEKRGLPQTQIDQMMNDWFAAHKKEVAPGKKTAVKAAPKAAEPVVVEAAPKVAEPVVAEVAEPVVAEAAPKAVEPVVVETTPEPAPAPTTEPETPAVEETATPVEEVSKS